MRFKSIVLLGATALLASVDGASVATGPKMTTVDFPANLRSLTDNQNGIPTEKLLRTSKTTAEDDEDRALGINTITGLAKAGMKNVADYSRVNVWLKQKNTGTEVLNQLELGNKAVDALTHSKMELLTKFFTKFNKKNPDDQISLIGTLTVRYGDDAMAQALVTARKSDVKLTKDIATQLSAQQLERWLNSGKSVDDVFTSLKLQNDMHLALYSRKLEILEDYIKYFNRKKPDQETSLLNTLTTGFGGEDKLASILATAKIDYRTTSKADELEKALIMKWGNEKLRPESVMNNLKVGGTVKALSNPTLGTVMNYISEFNKANPRNKFSLIGSFTKTYGDEAVAKALLTGRNSRTPDAANILQTKQLNRWLDSEKSVDDVFKMLALSGDDVLSMMSQKLETLEEYIKLFNAKYPQETTHLFKALSKGTDDAVNDYAILVSRVMATAFSENIIKAAKKYQKQLFVIWKNKDLNSEQVLKTVFAKASRNNRYQVDLIIRQYKTYYEMTKGAVGHFV